MNRTETRQCLLLHSLPDASDALLTRLLLHYGKVQSVWQSQPQDWVELGASPATIRSAKRIQSAGDLIEAADAQMATLESVGATIIALTDNRYPTLLRMIYDPPPLLYVRGNAALLQQAQLAIVGSRKASPAGVRAAQLLSGEAIATGLHICSGLARGIDAAAHAGALGAGGKSIAVMATGIDVIYPSRNRALAEELVQFGCLVTEFPPGSQPQPHRFPRRNRIISGLSLGVLVIEAALRSGSLITAGAAMEQGREVFALPWSMFHGSGRGCLRLIRDGAKMVQNFEDILEELGPLFAVQQEWLPVENRKKEPDQKLSAGQSRILAMVGFEVTTVDDLAVHSGLSTAGVQAALSVLELKGRIKRCPGGYLHC